MTNYITGSTIKTLREKKGYTQKQLAALLTVSDKTISKWETAKGLPDISLLEPLAKALSVSVTELLTGECFTNQNRAGNMLRSCFYVCPICGNVIHACGKGSFSCCGIALPPLEAEKALKYPDGSIYAKGVYSSLISETAPPTAEAADANSAAGDLPETARIPEVANVLCTPADFDAVDDIHAIKLEVIDYDYYLTMQHPMTRSHYISFFAYVTAGRVQFLKLYPEQEPTARFPLWGPGRIYAYCNQHGLYMFNVK